VQLGLLPELPDPSSGCHMSAELVSSSA
jgi:hypothetical protein